MTPALEESEVEDDNIDDDDGEEDDNMDSEGSLEDDDDNISVNSERIPPVLYRFTRASSCPPDFVRVNNQTQFRIQFLKSRVNL